MSVLSFTGLLSICVKLQLSVLLVIGVLKCFVTPTLTYTAQVDESVLHICFIMSLSICVELALSVLLVIRDLKCFVTLTLTSTAQVDESVLHICFYYHYVIEYMR